jgi:hypothetical protein
MRAGDWTATASPDGVCSSPGYRAEETAPARIVVVAHSDPSSRLGMSKLDHAHHRPALVAAEFYVGPLPARSEPPDNWLSLGDRSAGLVCCMASFMTAVLMG